MLCQQISSTGQSFDDVPNECYHALIGYSREQCESIYNEIGVPQYFTFKNGRHSFRIHGIHCFMFFLFRWKKPYAVIDDQKLWGYDYSVLSMMFNNVNEWLDETHTFRLRSLHRIRHLLPMYSSKILEKVVATCEQLHVDIVPPEAINCCGFVDASR